ncbi:MAG: M48 family metallopeptidase [Candidatus Gracilibacteria bacterium]
MAQKILGLQSFIWSNNIRSLILLALFPCILCLLVFLIFTGIVSAEGVPLESAPMSAWEMLYSFIGYIFSGVAVWFLIAWLFHQKMILAMTQSKPLDRKDNPMIYDIVERLCISRGLPMPKLYIIEDESMNAFASGLSPKNALISFSRGILNALNKDELEAVAAHELTHIMNRDIRLMVVAIIFVGIIQTVSEVFLRSHINISSDNKNGGNAMLIILAIKLVVFILGFLFTTIVQLAISRKREYLADAGSVELTKTGEHLITALQKISGDARIEVIENRSVAQMCIENPLGDHGSRTSIFQNLFSTHPAVEDRVRVLREIG